MSGWFALVQAPLLKSKRRAALLLGVLVLAVVGSWGFYFEPQSLHIRQVAVQSAAWQGTPLRIGVISDTHVGSIHVNPARVGRIVERMNALSPDVVVLLGDYVNAHNPARNRSDAENRELMAGIAAFADLRAPLGVYGVLGNHEVTYGDDPVVAALTAANVRVLLNAGQNVERAGGAFWIAGLRDRTSPVPPLPEEAFLGADGAQPSIMLTHQPDLFAQAPEQAVLTLAGHTHCGQVKLPLVGYVVFPSRGSRRWPCGLYREGDQQLYVTGGIGVSILPVRFRAPPEIAVVTLSRAAP